MCGRYDLSDLDGIAKRYDIELDGIQWSANHNIRPTQIAPVIVYDEQAKRNKLELMRWGIKPQWAKTPLINAQAENTASSRLWKPMLKSRRVCLVVANGFYEWDKQTRKPIEFTVKGESLISLGGLYDIERAEDGTEAHRFVIMTTAPNDTVGRVHNRMAFVVDRQMEGAYLTEPDTEGLLSTIAKPYPDTLMEAQEVGQL